MHEEEAKQQQPEAIRGERPPDMGRAPCCDKASVKKGPWSPEEDGKLKEYIHKNGTAGNWIALPQKAGNEVHKAAELLAFKFVSISKELDSI